MPQYMMSTKKSKLTSQAAESAGQSDARQERRAPVCRAVARPIVHGRREAELPPADARRPAAAGGRPFIT